MASLNEFVPIFKRLMASYPGYRPDDPKVSMRAYHRKIEPFESPVLEQAVDDLTKSKPLYMPTAGELETACLEISYRKRKTASGTVIVPCFHHHSEDLGLCRGANGQLLQMLCGCVSCHPEIWCPNCSRVLKGSECIYCGTKVLIEEPT